MRRRGFLLAAVAAAALWTLTIAGAGARSPTRATIDPGPATIRVTATLTSTRQVDASTTARGYDLLNRPSYRTRIGVAVLECSRVAPSQVACRLFLRFSRGQVAAMALLPAGATFLNLAIVGGTGYYANVGGTVTVQPLGGGTQLVIASLIAF